MTFFIGRREFITLLGGAARVAARGARAAAGDAGDRVSGQPSPDAMASRLAGFRQGLKEAGFIEGQNVTIDYRWAENPVERLPALAAELVHRQVAVFVAAGRHRRARPSGHQHDFGGLSGPRRFRQAGSCASSPPARPTGTGPDVDNLFVNET